MFGVLDGALDGLGVVADPEGVVGLIRRRDRMDSMVAASIAALDQSGAWALDGSVSVAAWLRQHTGMTPVRAKREATTAARVRRCPTLRDAWTDGRLSSGQVDVVVANVPDDLADLWEQHEAAVVPTLVPLSVRDTAAAMQAWAMRAKVQLELDGTAPDRPDHLQLSRLLDGRGRIDGNLSPEVMLVVEKALDLAMSHDADGEARTPGQRRQDAFGDICRHYLDHQRTRVAGRKRPHLNLVMDVDQLRDEGIGSDLYGHPIDGPTMRTLLCDATLHRVLRAGSSILDYGRATRTIPPALYTSLYLRDLGCRFPGCDRPGEWCEGHHLWPWEHGGPTNLANLALLCSRHHHLIHQPGWHLKLLPTATLEVTHPDGTTRTTDPPKRPPF